VAPVSAPYRPGQTPWPENQPRRPDRSPPIRFQHDPAPGGGTSALDWTLRIVGLVAVAVISGFLWWFLNNEEPKDPTTGFGAETSSQPDTAGEFDFDLEIDEPRVDDSCPEHAYGQIQQFLTQTPCERLTRAIYSTEIDGRTVYTSVSVVEMADEGQASQLRVLTDTDNTGNVNDLVREGERPIPGLEALSRGGGYASSQDDNKVIIVESDYDPGAADGGTEEELDQVCTDALRLSEEMTQA
jgi:hypothetical protein